MEQNQKPSNSPNYAMIGVVIGIALSIAFIVIGSVFFGLKPGPSTPTNSSDTIDPSLYRPTE